MKLETLETNKVKMTFEVGPERFSEGLRHSYLKNKSKMNMPGFRKGKAPQKMLEAQYEKTFFSRTRWILCFRTPIRTLWKINQ